MLTREVQYPKKQFFCRMLWLATIFPFLLEMVQFPNIGMSSVRFLSHDITNMASLTFLIAIKFLFLY